MEIKNPTVVNFNILRGIIMDYKTNGLTFNTLREADIERLKEPKYIRMCDAIY